MLTSYKEFRENPDMVFDFLDFFFKFKPTKYQKKFLSACLKRNRIAGKWPRQSGKSTTVAVYVLFRALVEPVSVIITAPTLTHSGELYNKIRNLANSNELVTPEIIRITQTELNLKNGSRIKALPSGTEGKSIRGFTADIAIEEEAGLLSDEINNSVILPMLASKGDEGQLIKIGTPLKKNHFHRSCFIDPTFEVINITWRDCVAEGRYTMTFVEEQRNNITDVQFKTEYEAQFIEELAQFFPLELVQSCEIKFEFLKNI